ncbi:hypothetical protein LCGC14_3004060 [marine sediment metagenome]|uniref:Uncharacterized protein n=1 Tax=marine sediment metagenome TaxID=412755 RepID=A0A0F8ZRC3_9ZZZZ
MTVKTVEHRMWGIGIAADEGFALPASDLRWLLERCELLENTVDTMRRFFNGKNQSGDVRAALNMLAEWEKKDGEARP